MVEQNAKSMPKPFAPNPQAASGWTASDLSPLELASRADRAMRELKGVYGEFTLYVKNKELEGHNRASFRIQDNRNYAIHYILPNDPTWINRMLSNGKEKVNWEAGKWMEPQAMAMSVAAWSSEFPRAIFDPLTADLDNWGPAVSAMKNAGYKLRSERKTMSGGGRTYHYYRICAEKSGGFTVELRFDAVRFVPLTVRVTSKDGKGFETQCQWQAKWSFNNKFSAKDFQIAPSAIKEAHVRT